MRDDSAETKPTFSTKRSRRFYEARLLAYSTAASVVYGMRVDRQTRTRWTELMMLGRAGDDWLDTGISAANAHGPEQHHAVNTFVEMLKNDEFSNTYPSLSRAELGDELFEKYVEATSRVVDASIRAKNEVHLLRHMTMRALEGAATAEVVTLLAREPLKHSRGYKHFAKHLRYAGAISTLCDSAWEFRTDTTEANVALHYSIENHARMIGSAVVSSARLARLALRKSRERD